MRTRSSCALALLALLASFALLALEAPARANEQSDVDKGRAAYLARQYPEADARFRAMLDPHVGTVHDAALVTQARMVWGAVKLAQKHPDDASALFEKILLDDPGYDPDPLSFPTEVIDAFIDTRARIRDKINAAAQAAAQAGLARKAREEEERRHQRERLVLLERMAGEERVTVNHQRLVAFVPFGIGQFQNGQIPLGYAFMAGEVALLVASAVTVPIYFAELQSRTDAAAAGDRFRANEYIARANDVRAVNLVVDGLFLVTAAAGIVQANLAFVPDVVELRKRPIPTVGSSLAPTVAPEPHGLSLGLRGSF